VGNGFDFGPLICIGKAAIRWACFSALVILTSKSKGNLRTTSFFDGYRAGQCVKISVGDAGVFFLSKTKEKI